MKTHVFKIAAIGLMLVTVFSSCTKEAGMDQAVAPDKETALESRTLADDTPFYYTENGGKEYFTVRRDKIIVKTASNVEAKALLNRNTSVFKQQARPMGAWVKTSVDAKTSLDDVLKLPGVVDASYGLEYANGVMQYLTDQIFIECAEPRSALATIGLTEADIVEIKEFGGYPDTYKVTLSVGLEQILSICQRLYESRLCVFAQPNLIIEPKLNNTHFISQWGLKNTGQAGGTPGIDIKAEQAWVLTRGNSNIKIAVIDDGVDLTHPDLQGNLLPGADFSWNPPGGSRGGYYGNDSHGTACAGIVAAINNSVGVVGVAPNCKILPIRTGYNDDNDPELEGVTFEGLINAFRHAWDTMGVDVISNSYEVGATNAFFTQEIVKAMTLGRGGKGCVVVFSAGNVLVGNVPYPANAHPDIIAVASIDRTGATMDGYYTPEIDVRAPGYQIYTTDLQGTAGESSLDYYSGFSGTSAAAPHVAGVAALLLSANPNLTQKQVANIIESTAQKVNPQGLYPYSTTPGRPNGPWNQQMGYGLVDAYAAVNYAVNPPALATPVISRELVDRPTGGMIDVVYSVDAPQSGVMYEWDVNGTIVQSSSTPYVAFLSVFRYPIIMTTRASIAATVKCRAYVAGSFSPWSNTFTDYVESLTPVSYRP